MKQSSDTIIATCLHYGEIIFFFIIIIICLNAIVIDDGKKEANRYVINV